MIREDLLQTHSRLLRMRLLLLFMSYSKHRCDWSWLSAAAIGLSVLSFLKGFHAEADRARLDAFLDIAYSKEYISDGIVAQDGRQASALWRLREDVSVAVSTRGHTFKYDLSFPLPSMYDLVGVVRQRLSDAGLSAETTGVVPVGYGHLGDCNLHLNVSTRGKGREGAALRETVLVGQSRALHVCVYVYVRDVRGFLRGGQRIKSIRKHFCRFSRPIPLIFH